MIRLQINQSIYLHVKSLTCCLLCPSRRIHDSPWLCMVEACYDNFVTTINRALPVCIAVYRWGALVTWVCHVPRVQVLPRVPRPHPHVPGQQEAAAAGAAGLHARWLPYHCTAVTRAVNEPSRSFTVPGEGPNMDLLLIERAYKHFQIKNFTYR